MEQEKEAEGKVKFTDKEIGVGSLQAIKWELVESVGRLTTAGRWRC